VTFEEFLAWADEDTWAEWVDGEVVLLTPASTRHQIVSRFLSDLLGNFALLRGLGVVLPPPYLVKLPPPVNRGREPDLVFVAADRSDLLKPTYCDGAPNLVVEVTSPESFARDRGEKFVEYEAAGVKEYWLVDPDRRQAEFYVLGEDGRYHPVPAQAGVYRSRVLPGLALKLEWLWQDPPPAGVAALREMGVI
jgi:Uma2 family endonuclease